MASDNPNLETETLGRGKRHKKITPRMKQMLEESQNTQTTRERRSISNAIAAEVTSQPPLDDDNDEFFYGAAENYIEPTLTGNDSLDQERYREVRAQHILRKLAIYGGEDWRRPWEQQEVDLDDLEKVWEMTLAGQTPTLASLRMKGAGAGKKGNGKQSSESKAKSKNLRACASTHGETNNDKFVGVLSVQEPENAQESQSEPDPDQALENKSDEEQLNQAQPNHCLTVITKPGFKQKRSALDDSDNSNDSSTRRRRKLASHLKMATTNAKLLYPLPSRTNSRRAIDSGQISRPQAYDDSQPMFSDTQTYSVSKPCNNVSTGHQPTRAPHPPCSYKSGSHHTYNRASKPGTAVGPKTNKLRSANSGRVRFGGSCQVPTCASRHQSSSQESNPQHQNIDRPNCPPRSRGIIDSVPRSARLCKPPTNNANHLRLSPHTQSCHQEQLRDYRQHGSDAVVPAAVGGCVRPVYDSAGSRNTINRIRTHVGQCANTQANAFHPSTRKQATTATTCPRASTAVASYISNATRRRAGHNSPPEVDTEEIAETGTTNRAEFGNIPNIQGNPHEVVLHNSKITVNSFAPVTRSTVKLMVRIATAEILAGGTYEWSPVEPGVQIPSHDEIVAKAWVFACEKLGTKYPLLPEHSKYVNITVTSFRLTVKHHLESELGKFWQFAEGNRAGNRELYEDLLPHGFHEVVGPDGVTPFSHPYIFKACERIAFKGRHSFGVSYPDYFNPIPWRFIAFICAITNNIISSWSSGVYHEIKLKVDQQTQTFRKYLMLLAQMSREQPNTLETICTLIYDDCRGRIEKQSGRAPSPEQPRQWAPDRAERYVSRYRVPSAKPYDADHDEDCTAEWVVSASEEEQEPYVDIPMPSRDEPMEEEYPEATDDQELAEDQIGGFWSERTMDDDDIIRPTSEENDGECLVDWNDLPHEAQLADENINHEMIENSNKVDEIGETDESDCDQRHRTIYPNGFSDAGSSLHGSSRLSRVPETLLSDDEILRPQWCQAALDTGNEEKGFSSEGESDV